MTLGFEKQYTFENPANYDFNADYVQALLNKLGLKIQEGENFYEQDYSNPANFTYDPTKVEFVGGKIQQIDKRPADATFYASFLSELNANWGNGSLVASPVGSPAIVDGMAALIGGTKYLNFSPTGNVGFTQTGCVRFLRKPNYSGSPLAVRTFFSASASASSLNNLFSLRHMTDGYIYIQIYSATGVPIINQNIGIWNPTAGTAYEIELDFDLTAGATRLFINRVQFGATMTATGTRDLSIGVFRVGAGYAGTFTEDAYTGKFIVFSAVQHVANYAPGADITPTVFHASTVTMPEMGHVGIGTIVQATDFETLDEGDPGYTLQIDRSGDYLYWDGEDWSPAGEGQSTTGTVFDENVESLPVAGGTYGQFKLHFSAGSVQQWVDLTSISLIESTGYTTVTQKVKPVLRIEAGRLASFLEDVTTPTGTQVKYTVEIDSVEKYWNGSRVVTSDGTIDETNTAEEINDHIVAFLDRNALVRPVFYLKTDDNQVTPEITSTTLYYQEDPDGLRGFLDDILDFVGVDSLTDEEFETIELDETPAYSDATYQALKTILVARESVSSTLERLENYFSAAGVTFSTDETAVKPPVSNIFIGGDIS